MAKRVFVSADWKESHDMHSCDKEVVDRIRKWRDDKRYGVDIICTDEVHGSVTEKPDCRRCEIKGECGRFIDWSGIVIIVVGDNTITKSAGSCDGVSCSPAYSGQDKKGCKYKYKPSPDNPANDVLDGLGKSYLEYEIMKAIMSKKSIILVFNSMRKEEHWIPSLYKQHTVNELCRFPFWKDKEHTQDCYQDMKGYLQ